MRNPPRPSSTPSPAFVSSPWRATVFSTPSAADEAGEIARALVGRLADTLAFAA
jgi:hypothetical protein